MFGLYTDVYIKVCVFIIDLGAVRAKNMLTQSHCGDSLPLRIQNTSPFDHTEVIKTFKVKVGVKLMKVHVMPPEEIKTAHKTQKVA